MKFNARLTQNKITRSLKLIEQVAQVIHKNSATAEQSAAVIEVMNSQANILQELVGRFGTEKGSDRIRENLPVPVQIRHDPGFSISGRTGEQNEIDRNSKENR